MKLAIVIGTHAEFLKMMPLMLELEKQKIKYFLIATGQHDLNKQRIEFKIKTACIYLDKREGFKSNTGNAIKFAIKSITPLTDVLSALKPDFVLYHGDTMSTVIAAIATRKAHLIGVHVEAGLRSKNLLEPFPEEIARIIADRLCDIAFAPSKKSVARLANKKYKYCVGNTVFDSIKIVEKNKLFLKKLEGKEKEFALASIHRHENIKSRERMLKIINILKASPHPVRWYLHKNTEAKLAEYEINLTKIPGQKIIIKAPVSYSMFLALIENSSLVFTDGGSMQEECAYFDKPCVILRMNTEREELVHRKQFLSKLSIKRTKEWLYYLGLVKFTVLENSVFVNPYYKKDTSKQIIAILLQIHNKYVPVIHNIEETKK